MRTLTPAYFDAIRETEQVYVAAVRRHNPTHTKAGDAHPEIVRALADYRAARKAARPLMGRA